MHDMTPHQSITAGSRRTAIIGGGARRNVELVTDERAPIAVHTFHAPAPFATVSDADTRTAPSEAAPLPLTPDHIAPPTAPRPAERPAAARR